MKLQYIFFCLIVVFTTVIEAGEENLSLTYETLSDAYLLSSSQYPCLTSIDQGHHKTIFRAPDFPDVQGYILKLERSLQKDITLQVSRKEMAMQNEVLEEDVPCFIVTGRGFLPGEKITVSVESIDGKFVSKKISFFPHQIIQETSFGKISAELIILNPTTFIITLAGLQANEKLHMTSSSSREKIEHDFLYQEGSPILLTPGVQGENGGTGHLLITRENGDQLFLNLPWGSKLIPYANGTAPALASNFTRITTN